ncbi:MAG: hypothetical protein CM15mP77_4550 [Synechococcus sp.]|nr:MAG: hypothetical protein CM15mP77_4550 [Synechococcus sp.]
MVGLPSHPELAMGTTRTCGSCGATTAHEHRFCPVRSISVISVCWRSCWLRFPFHRQRRRVLQVRTASLLQVGDGNRTYTVQLACIEVEPDAESAPSRLVEEQLPVGGESISARWDEAKASCWPGSLPWG